MATIHASCNPGLRDASSEEERRFYDRHVNPISVTLLDALGMNVQYTHCSGSEFYTADSRTILDCVSGYGVHNVGHNHPRVVSELVAELQSQSTASVFWIDALNLGRCAMSA